MIEFRNVTKVYDTGTAAVNNTSLYIEKGEFVFIVGRSGCGKSTLMKMIMKEEEPTSGHIFVNGIDITRISKRRIPNLRRSMGIVFQDFRLLPDKTVYENVAYAMRVIEANPKLIKKQVPNVLSLVGLLDKADDYPDQLSGGEQQRVAIARAIVNNPSVLIADEPTGNLDPINAWEIMSLLNEINRRGTTVVVATHAKDIVDKMQKRVIAIEKGVVYSDKEGGSYTEEQQQAYDEHMNDYSRVSNHNFPWSKRKVGV
jgi:cell division transport system ATP-binding protein